MTLEITPSQKWLLLKTLLDFTSDESRERFFAEYPDCDEEELVKDLNDLLKKLERTK